MKGEEILEQLEFVDLDLVQDAESIPVKAGRKYRKWVLAACISVVLAAALVPALLGIRQTSDAKDAQGIQLNGQQTSGPSSSQPPQASQPAEGRNLNFLTLDINPSLQLAVENGVVVEVLALNDDGERIFDGLSLTGMGVEDALPLVIDALIEQGYLAAAEHAPVMLLSARGAEGAQELLETATGITRGALEEKKVETYIVTQRIEDVHTVERLADQYGVPVGKMQYVLNILRQEADLTLEEASACTILELFGLDVERRLIEPAYKVGEYDEYGEMILWVGDVEDYLGYLPWEELSQEYKEELKQMYTPEALEILAMPRVWTTMPNVVGLPEHEALELLYSRKIAPCICYEYNADAWAAGYTAGMCFQQDKPQGHRHNSDACVYIWILLPKENTPK